MPSFYASIGSAEVGFIVVTRYFGSKFWPNVSEIFIKHISNIHGLWYFLTIYTDLVDNTFIVFGGNNLLEMLRYLPTIFSARLDGLLKIIFLALFDYWGNLIAQLFVRFPAALVLPRHNSKLFCVIPFMHEIIDFLIQPRSRGFPHSFRFKRRVFVTHCKKEIFELIKCSINIINIINTIPINVG